MTATVAGPARTTPHPRDRYVDLLRVVSLGVVVLGHWLMTVVVVAGGAMRVTNLLALVPATHYLTWLLQVMPIFFLVGGFSHATALDSIRRRGGGYADFVRARAGRLLRPTVVFAAAWLTGAILLDLLVPGAPLQQGARLVAQPLWFLGVYLALVVLAPPLLDLHRQLGRWAPAVPVAAAALIAVVDTLRWNGVPQAEYLNLLLVWVALHQLGYAYADGALVRGGRRLAATLAVGGLGAVLALTLAGPYPVSMVGVPGQSVSNMSPPTLALYAHGVWLTGLALLLRPAGRRWLRRPLPWRVVVTANGVAMSAFLWHLTALVLVVAAVSRTPFVPPAAASPLWWLTRPVWLTLLAAVTALLVALVRAADRPRPAAIGGPPGTAWVAAAGGLLCTLGVFGFSAVGFGGVLTGRTVTMIDIPITVGGSASLLGAGAALLLLTGPWSGQWTPSQAQQPRQPGHVAADEFSSPRRPDARRASW